MGSSIHLKHAVLQVYLRPFQQVAIPMASTVIEAGYRYV